MIHYLRGQVLTALLGAFILIVLLGYLAYTTTTVTVPEAGGIYVEGLAGRPSSINPLLSQFNQVDVDLASLIFSGLTRSDLSGATVPDLAERWEISPDGTRYSFYLRRGVRWHDGPPFTADDVVFTIQAIQDPEFQGPPQLAQLWRAVTVEKIDNYAVAFILPEPFSPFLSYTSLGLLPRHLLGGVPARDLPRNLFNVRPIGTGPFRLVELSYDRAALEAFPPYYDQPPRLSRIEFRFYPDVSSVWAAYLRGEIQGVTQVRSEDLEEARRQENLVLYSAPTSGYALIFLNLIEPALREKEVRQALLWGIDRQRIIDQILEGQAIVAHSIYPPGSWAFKPDIPHYFYDPNQARTLLEAAGWMDQDGDGVREKEGVPLEFSLLTNDDPLRRRIIEEIARQLWEIGIKVNTLVLGNPGIVQEALAPRRFMALLYEWGDLPADPDAYEMWHSTQTGEGGQNYPGWSNRDADEALEEARRTSDPARRKELYDLFQRVFAEEVPAILLYHPIYTYGVDARVGGVQLAPLTNPSDRFRTIAQWYVNVQRVLVSEAED